MRGTQADQAFFRFAVEQALLRGFDAVIDGVAQQMRQRCFELFQHIAVDLSLLAFDLQAYLFAEAAAQIADHAYLTVEHVGEWPHPAGQRGVIKHLRTVTGLPGELIEFGVFPDQQLLGFSEQTPRILQRFQRLKAQRVFLEVDVEVFQCAQTVVLHPFEALHGGKMRLETLGFHQRFARQIEQAVQAFGSDSQYALATLSAAFAVAWRRFE